MALAKDPLRQLLDLAVYAPIGLLTLAQRELPHLIESGRARVDSQITLARFIGRIAVTKGKQELQRRLDAAEQARHASAPSDSAGRDDETGLPRTLPEAIIAAVEATAVEVIADNPQAPSVDLPIEGYDSLAASQVVLRLTSLNATELDLVRQHETTHRARRTILGKISQLQAS